MKSLRILWVVLGIAMLSVHSTWAAGESFQELRVGEATYLRVVVLSSNASSLSIRHSKGISQVPLSQLSSELQAQFGYDPALDEKRKDRLESERSALVVEEKVRLAKLRAEEERKLAASMPNASAKVAAAFRRFGKKPTLEREVDMRDAFRQHSLSVRDQGMKPSCSVHSIVAAIEYQYAEFEGLNLNISESLLFRATSESLGRSDRGDVEAGFSLSDVFQAIRGYGLSVEKSYLASLAPADLDQVTQAQFSSYRLPGGQSESGLGNIVHVLNQRMPVVIGLAWPEEWRLRQTAVLDKQPPAEGGGHAVTLVGYRCETGRLEDTKFIFRNSWGAKWGAGGYGFVSYEYLSQNLWVAYVVELK